MGRQRVRGRTVVLDDYWIDRFEVTNRQFKTFVDAGGYRTRSYWTEPFMSGTRTLSWEEAMAAVPRYHRAARTCDMGARHVSGGAGGLSGWRRELVRSRGVRGVRGQESPHRLSLVQRGRPRQLLRHSHASNYGGKGPAPVGQYQGLGPLGTSDMAGNVKEWCSTASGASRFIPGGGWNEPSYMFTDLDAQAPFDRQPTYGFRCVKYIKPPPAAAFNAIDQRARDFTQEKPVSDEVFEVMRRMYAYDRRPLKEAVEGVEDEGQWRKETRARSTPGTAASACGRTCSCRRTSRRRSRP